MASVLMCISLALLIVLLVNTTGAVPGWLKVVGAGDYMLNIQTRDFTSDTTAAWYYASDPSNGLLENLYERASQGVVGGGDYSVSDDFTVPAGKVAQTVMLALQGVRSFNLATTLNPSKVIIAIMYHNSTYDGPDHWRPALKWFDITAPAGGWHNMSRDVPASNTNPTSTGIIDGAYDWFALNVSDLNGGQGLGEGHYWFSIRATVQDHSAYDSTTNSWSIGNNYAVVMSYGVINYPDGGVIQGNNPGFGSAAKLPYSYGSTGSCVIDIDPKYSSSLTWTRTSTCAYDPSGACDLSMLVFLWTDVTVSDKNVFQGTLPPPSCKRNTVPYARSDAEPNLYLLPAYACPGKYYVYTDAISSQVSSSSTTTNSSIPSNVPTSHNSSVSVHANGVVVLFVVLVAMLWM
jgi:hypothetical protein